MQRASGRWRETARPAGHVSAVKLPFFDFVQSFAVHALGGGRAGLKPAQSDLYAAGVAVTEIPLIDPFQRLIYFFDQFSFPVSSAQLDAELFLLRGSVGRIGKVGSLIAHMVHGAVHLFHEILAPLQENVPEVSNLDLAHVVLTLFGFVGGKGPEGRVYRAC